MPEHLRALIVILALAAVSFAALRKPLLDFGMVPADFRRRRNLWLGVTLAAFLASNFWIFMLVATALLLFGRTKERNPFALYLFLLFTVPPFAAALGGLGIVNQLFQLNFPRLLSLVILLPWALKKRDPDTSAFGKQVADWLLLGYLLLQLYQQYQIDTLTNTLRSALYFSLDAVLPYYVASRSLKSTADLRDALLSFVVAGLLMVPLAVFEFLKHWLLYSALSDALGMFWDAGSYLARGNTLRATVTAGHSIAFGYVMMTAIMLHFALRSGTQSRTWAIGAAALTIGAIAAVSRGPWVGTAAGVIVFVAAGHRPGKRLLKLAMLGGVSAAVLLISPWGQDVINYLPFVGSVDSGNVDYRQQLFEVSMLVISQHPFFGSPTFMYSAPLQDLQNGGLIDVVNSYLLVALQIGYVGLALFVAAFVRAGWGLVVSLHGQQDKESERYLQGRALLAALAAILVAIATVSNISVIPIVYWCVAGLAVGYGQGRVAEARDGRRGAALIAVRTS